MERGREKERKKERKKRNEMKLKLTWTECPHRRNQFCSIGKRTWFVRKSPNSARLSDPDPDPSPSSSSCWNDDRMAKRLSIAEDW